VAQDPSLIGGRRVITIEADAWTLDGQAKEGLTDDGFRVFCDEAEKVGGANSAPSPMRYFALSIGF